MKQTFKVTLTIEIDPEKQTERDRLPDEVTAQYISDQLRNMLEVNHSAVNITIGPPVFVCPEK